MRSVVADRGGKEEATKGRRAHSTPPFHYLRIDPFKASLQIHDDFWVGRASKQANHCGLRPRGLLWVVRSDERKRE